MEVGEDSHQQELQGQQGLRPQDPEVHTHTQAVNKSVKTTNQRQTTQKITIDNNQTGSDTASNYKKKKTTTQSVCV